MSHGLLEILRFFLLALIWLFFLYAARMVIVEVRRGRADAPTAEAAAAAARPRAAPRPAPAPSGGARPTKLRILEPAERRGTAFDLDQEITLGRSPGCAVPLDGDTYASSVHARVYLRDGETWIEDLGSTNGTFLNGERVAAPVRLRKGDRLKIGHTLLEAGR